MQALRLEITCKPLEWQLSAVAQVLNSFLSSLPTLDSLEIAVSRKDRQGGKNFYARSPLKDMTLEFKDSVRLVAPALQELAGERATEVLLALRNLFLRTYDWQPSGPVNEAIEQFITTRQLCGRPVTVVTVLY